jgi:hypothetical protein
MIGGAALEVAASIQRAASVSTALKQRLTRTTSTIPKSQAAIDNFNPQSTITNPAIVNPQSLQSTTSDQHSSIINPQ